ncbi:MAG: hypothetical protein RJA34_788 [Pseudomonadota bacterium]
MNQVRRLWLVSIAASVVLVGTVLLGRWQLQRASMKEQLAEQSELCQTMPALSIQDLSVMSLDAVCDQRKVTLTGQWVAAKTVYLDNRQMNGRPGFFVVTPFTLDGTQDSILVQRGWLPRNFVDRVQVQKIETPNGQIVIQGRLVPPPSKLYELGTADAGLIRQNLDLASFAAETGLKLLDKSVQQTGESTEGLQRDWLVVASSADKHYGYAFQWFGLSGLTFILYVWFQIVRFRAKKQ